MWSSLYYSLFLSEEKAHLNVEHSVGEPLLKVQYKRVRMKMLKFIVPL